MRHNIKRSLEKIKLKILGVYYSNYFIINIIIHVTLSITTIIDYKHVKFIT
jgi:hypothetical protein